MADNQRLICASSALVEKSGGVRFELPGATIGFVVRFGGVAHAYLNRCAHLGVELDWMPGEFFDAKRQFLLCATHDALYDPANGLCVQGPCRGQSLQALRVEEHNGNVYLIEENLSND